MLEYYYEQDICIVRVISPFSLDDVHDLIEKVETDCKKKVILDFQEIKLLNSTILGLTAAVFRNLYEMKVPLGIIGVDENNIKLFQISGIGKLVSVYKTKEEALSLLQSFKNLES